MDNAKGLRIVESKILHRYRVPTQVMGNHSEVTAFVKVAAHTVSGLRGKTGKVLMNEAIGNSIDGFPAAGDSFSDGRDGVLIWIQTGQCFYICTNPNEQTAIGITFDVHIPGIIDNRTEEEF